MDGLEIVSVRLADCVAVEEAVNFCHAVLALGPPGRIQIYRGIGSGTDLSVHIHWTYSPFRQEKSLLGLQLAHGLGDYGLVSHSVWIDQTGTISDGRNASPR